MSRPAAIVTGGARGIGLACAEALAESGYDILVADLAEKADGGLAVDITARGAAFAYHRCDIADLASRTALVDAAINAFGRIDCLVNNAGVGAVVRGDLLELKPENFDRTLSINLRGTVFLSQAVAKAMLATPGDHRRSIITITSVSAEMASPERSDYCISKAGLSMWVKNLALRLAAENIAVFEVRPGIIRTDMTAGVTAKYDASIGGGLVPAKRWGEADDIGAVVASLASGKFGFSTGSIINVDGALSVPRLYVGGVMTDYIIVGAGPAGCVLANRLSEDPANSVLLLEAGGKDWHPYIHMPAGFAKMTKGIASWGWSTVPQKHMQNRVFWYTQAKVVGGGSSINAQIYTRGNARDYDAWEKEEGLAGWGYRDVLPYFKRAENNQRYANDFHGDQGPLGVSNPISPLPICEAYFRAGQELGIPFNPDFNGASQAGVGYYQLTQKDARRSSASVAYLRPVRARKNLTIRTNVLVTRIVVEKGRAIGVEIVDKPGGQKTVLRAEREVIVSSGAIGSPKLLMQSGIGPADHLKSVGVTPVHDLHGVGSNMQDHLDLFVIAECTGDHTYDNYAKLHRTAWAGLQYLLLKKGPVASSLFETGGFWYADPTAASPDIQFHLGLGSGIEAGVEKLRNPGVTLNSAFLRPRSRGTVRLKSADPADHPLIDPNYWSDPYDRDMSIKGLRLAREIMRQKALQPYVLREVLPGPTLASGDELFDYACRSSKTDHHPVGTCRMGYDEMAVVTPDLQLRGIEALRVCDASVMPRVPSSNTNAPTIMVGEKGADLILGREPLPPAVFTGNRAA